MSIEKTEKAQTGDNQEQKKLTVILATGNQDKVREIAQIASDDRLCFMTMRKAGFTDEIIEDGSSFAQNALIKARAVHAVTGGTVMADDSGLSVDMLDGAPGIYSARFAGDKADYKTKINKLYQMLKHWPQSQWHAAFICVIALVMPDGSEKTFYGACRGMITKEAAGSNGFGYDPVFYIPSLQKTTAQLEPEQKHAISHRGKALRAACQYLLDQIQPTRI